MNHPKSIIAALGISLALLAGCKSAPIAGEPDSVSEYPKVTLSSKSLAKAIALNPATVTRSATDNLEVSQPIRSLADGGIDIQYKLVWLDEMGRPISPEMTWRYKRLEPRIPDFVSASSSSDEAIDYRLHLRWSRP